MLKSLYEVQNRIEDQKKKINENFANVALRLKKDKIGEHLKDLKLIDATAKAVSMFIVIRLVLGLFGMDLYEIYWWFSAGLVVALFNMNKYAEIKTNKLLKSRN